MIREQFVLKCCNLEVEHAVEIQFAATSEDKVFREGDEFSEEIRQMIVGRYRVLFTIRKGKVPVLHVRGAHVRGRFAS